MCGGEITLCRCPNELSCNLYTAGGRGDDERSESTYDECQRLGERKQYLVPSVLLPCRAVRNDWLTDADAFIAYRPCIMCTVVRVIRYRRRYTYVYFSALISRTY